MSTCGAQRIERMKTLFLEMNATDIGLALPTRAFAYRFDAPDRSIVISGDTTESDELIRLARDADILVHEAMYPAAVDRMISDVANASDLKRSTLSHHC